MSSPSGSSRLPRTAWLPSRIFASVLFISALLASATAPATDQDSEIIIVPAGDSFLRWTAEPGRTYFIQASASLDQWQWSDLIETGQGQQISYEIGSNSGRGFVRLVHTDEPVPQGVTPEDWDADGDGLSNHQEIATYQTHPLLADTSGDGLIDGWAVAHGLNPLADNGAGLFQGGPSTNLEAYQAGVLADPDATLDDHDADEVPNDADADPSDPDVTWSPAPEASYVLIDIDHPLAEELGLEINDKGEVLFQNGIWSAGNWIDPGPDGPFDYLVGDPEVEYSITGSDLHHFNTDGSLLGLGSSPDPYGGDPLLATIHRPAGQSAGPLGDFDDYPDVTPFSYRPRGLDAAGKAYCLESTSTYSEGAGWEYFSHVTIFTPGGDPADLPNPVDRFPLPNEFAEAFDVTRNGWVALNAAADLQSPYSNARPVLWNDQGALTSLPDALTGWFSGLALEEIEDGPAILCTTGSSSAVLVPDEVAQGQPPAMRIAGKLTAHGILRFAPDGTGMTADQHLWRNGELLPLADLCEDLAEAGAAGRFVVPVDANRSGAWLVHLHDSAQTAPSETKILLPASIVPDHNRDGLINFEDRGQISEAHPWRFWVNDDDDSGETGGDDVPRADPLEEPDYLNGNIDGIRDLVDFFALKLELGDLTEVLPPGSFDYFLTHDSQLQLQVPGNPYESSLGVIWRPDVDPGADPVGDEAAGSYLFNLDHAEQIGGAAVHDIPEDGLLIPGEMLDAADQDQGVVLVEGRHATTNPLALEVRKNDGTVVARMEFTLRVSGVEDMLRWLYVLPGAADLTTQDIPADPPNWPDADRNGKHFVFVHGYNVSGEVSRGWAAETFKRLFWSGSNARFTALAWRGNQGQIAGITPDYQVNLDNAFGTAASFKQLLDLLEGEKTVAAHSMGNILVGSAMHDWGARPEHYFMLDAAAAKECYDPTEAGDADQDTRMAHPAWTWVGYPKEFRASEWHARQWTAGDHRATLTWKGRFRNVIANGGLTEVYNFYSSGEEVLNNPETNNPDLDTSNPFSNGNLTWTKANKAWAMQEKRKGLGLTGYVQSSNHGGWLPNLYPYDTTIHVLVGQDAWRMRFPVELPQPPDMAYYNFLASLTTRPFFDNSQETTLFHFDEGPGTTGSEHARTRRNTIISEMIPCTTFAAGRNPFNDPISSLPIDRNIDMHTSMMTDSSRWPESDEHDPEANLPRPWLHSDFRVKAFTHNWKLFKTFIDIAYLNESDQP